MFSIFTSIPYVNAAPHVGHALEFFEGDLFARYHRMRGQEVHFQVGADMYGQKNWETAQEKNMSVEDFTDHHARLFETTKDTLHISYDAFVRTHSDRHRISAQKLWSILEAKGDIYKDTYTGNYCVGCESYLLDTDLEDGLCPIHKKAPTLVSEENHFFRLSKYSDAIKEAITSGAMAIEPRSRANEILNVIEGGLRDVSFSRPRSSLSWGIPVPSDDNFVMYVWCDALSNYLTGIGFGDDPATHAASLPADLHILGKDILRFHAAIWPAMLLSADLPLPKRLLVHGFITSEGHKMSKSLGNVVNPSDILFNYGLDAFRAFFLGVTPLGADMDFTWDKFHEFYETELVNNLGNFTNRVIVMTDKYLEGTATPLRTELPAHGQNVLEVLSLLDDRYHEHMEALDHKRAFETILEALQLGNQYINQQEPWKLAKEDMEATIAVMTVLQEVLAFIGIHLLPFVPDTSEKILRSLGLSTKVPYFSTKTHSYIREQHHLTSPGHLFPRIAPEDIRR